MQAYRPRPAEPVVQAEETQVFTDFLWIGFTIFVAFFIGSFLYTNTADEIVEYFEDDGNVGQLAIVMIALVVILLYASHFYYHKRYEIMVDVVLDLVSAGQNNVFQVRSSFSWLMSFLAVVQPSRKACKRMNVALKYFFQFCLLLLVAVIGSFLCTGREIEYLAINFVVLGIYYVLSFSQDAATFERVVGHLGYTFLHAGTMFSYCGYDGVSHICINSGLTACILSVSWYFVNVPMNRETTRRRRRL